MNILCIGGGPAGLYAALSIKRRNPQRRVTLIERNRPDATFGWGIVLPEQALEQLHLADAESASAIAAAAHRWDAIDVCIRGQRIRSGGHGFYGIARARLLDILVRRCGALGVDLRFGADIDDPVQVALSHGADVVLAADGANSRVRTRYAADFQPRVEARGCRYIWLGTARRFDAFTFAFEQTEHGWFQAHIYPHASGESTFIVETTEAAWERTGFDGMTQNEGIAFCEKLFAAHLAGEHLQCNAPHLPANAAWERFHGVQCASWVRWQQVDGKALPFVLLGDAAHTAHFSIGSGTRLAIDDAVELAERIVHAEPSGMHDALAGYQAARQTAVLKLQNAARNSMEWFEHVARYAGMAPEQFAYSLLTRSQRMPHESLRLRDPGFVARHEAWFGEHAFAQAGLPVPAAALQKPVPPMLTPFRVRELVLPNRIVVSPMAQYSAVDGLAGDYHLAHLGSRAMGGAGLVCAEMTAVSADARITPGCPGIYRTEHVAAWKRIVDFVHLHSFAKIALQIGHAGPKGATRRAWDGIDLPLEQGGWPLLAASDQQYVEGVSQPAQAMTLADMARIETDFVQAAQRADEAGFDWLELHCAHGYLLSSFISPLTNRRGDEFGGALENRCRFPLRVLTAVRAAWPQHKPLSVRISAHDWVDGGTTPDDAVQIARLFKAAGADVIDCSSGQVSRREQPAYGRMYQTPFADRIRNEAGIATIAVGGIESGDQVNGIIAAGRADLCAIGRPHLANPAWTLTEAARLGWTDIDWPKPYHAARRQFERSQAAGLPRR